MNKVNKKGTKELGIGIIAFAMLILIGGILSDNPISVSEKDQYSSSKTSNYPEENYLFYLEDFDLGKEQKITSNYPNVEIGSKEELNSIYIRQYLELKSNMFKKNEAEIRLVVTSREDLKELQIYSSSNQLSGDENLIFKINGKEVAEVPSEGYFPVTIRDIPQNDTFVLSVSLNKPKWYELFNWNKLELTDFRIIEVLEDSNEKTKQFSFDVNSHEYLDELLVDLVVSCDVVKEYSESISVKVNDYIVGNQNPSCASRYNRMTFNISKNILNDEDEPNILEFQTEGYYKLGYSIIKTYYNDQEVYKFNIQDFSEVFDVIMYGDFNKETIDVEINKKIISLERDEIKSILPYLRIGVNQIEFRDMPLEIDEFVIETLNYNYND